MRTPLVPPALVIGSISPDIVYYVPVPVDAETTHSWVGVLSVDPLLGLAALAVWHLLLRVPAQAALPPTVRQRLALRAGTPSLSARGSILVLSSLAIGALTHVVWDEFTHVGRWGPDHLTWLRDVHGSLPGYRWAQYASGLFGALCLLWWTRQWLRRTSERETDEPGWGWPWAWLLVLAGGVLVGGAAAVPSLTADPSDLRSAGTDGATAGGSACGCIAILLAVLWHRRASRIRRTSGGRPVRGR